MVDTLLFERLNSINVTIDNFFCLTKEINILPLNIKF